MVEVPLRRTDEELVADDVGSASSELAADGFDSPPVVHLVSHGYEEGDVLTGKADAMHGLAGVLPVCSRLTVGLQLNGQHEALAVLHLTDVHTLDADSFSTQFVGYVFSNSLTAVVNYDN